MSTIFRRNVYQWLLNIQFGLLPGTCVCCKRASHRQLDLCQSCEATLPRISHPCSLCGLPLPTGYQGRNCGTCLHLKPPWTRLCSPFSYEANVRQCISAFKYRGRLVAGRVLTNYLLNTLNQEYRLSGWPDLIIPVPLHRKRLRQRGYNQALEISRTISGQTGIPLCNHLVKRSKDTKKQTGLSARDRKNNVRHAFDIPSKNPILENKTVALVDDVITTGVTLTELAHCFGKTGVKEIHVWTLARTVL